MNKNIINNYKTNLDKFNKLYKNLYLKINSKNLSNKDIIDIEKQKNEIKNLANNILYDIDILNEDENNYNKITLEKNFILDKLNIIDYNNQIEMADDINGSFNNSKKVVKYTSINYLVYLIISITIIGFIIYYFNSNNNNALSSIIVVVLSLLLLYTISKYIYEYFLYNL